MTGTFKRTYRWGVAFATAALLATTASADTIRSAMADAYRNSQLLEQNRILLRIQDEGVNQAAAQLLPVLSFVAGASRDLENDTTTTTASLVAEMVLYQGGSRRAARDAARETVLGARQQLVSVEQQVLLDAAVAYLNVWTNQQVVSVSQRNVRVIAEQLRAARDRFEVGEDTRTDVAQAEAQLAQAQSNLAAGQGQLEISRELFNLTVGRYPGAISSPGNIPNLPTSEAEADRLARQTSPSILALQHDVRAAEFAAREARGGLLPTLSAEARVTETFDAPLPAQEGRSSSIGLTLSQPIYRGGQLASLERVALAQVAAARFALNQQVRVNVQQMGNAYAQYRIAEAQIAATDQRITAAQLAFEGVREEASLGARTTLDVLDAEQALLDARVSRIEAQSALYQAAYGILSAGGLLTVERLGLPVPEYDPAAYPDRFGAGQPRLPSSQGARLDAVLERIGRE